MMKIDCGGCCAKSLSHVWLFMTPWTVAHQAPLSMVFPRQEYWSVLPHPPPGDLPNPGIKPTSSMLAGGFLTISATWEALIVVMAVHLCEYTKNHWIVLLLLLSHFSHVWLCETPETAAHQAPPSLGFSRQEHWSGLPFPSPMHESEKWKWSRSVMFDS